MDNSKLVKMLEQGKDSPAYKKALAHIYDTYRSVLTGRLSFGYFSLPMDIAQDLYSDAIIVFIRKVSKGKKPANIGGYLWVILKNLAANYWRKQLSEEKKRERFQQGQTLVVNPEEDMQKMDYQEGFDRIKRQLKNKCIELLSLNAEGYSAQEVAHKLAYKGNTVVRVVLQRCREKVRKIVDKDPVLRQLLGELFPRRV